MGWNHVLKYFYHFRFNCSQKWEGQKRESSLWCPPITCASQIWFQKFLMTICMICPLLTKYNNSWSNPRVKFVFWRWKCPFFGGIIDLYCCDYCHLPSEFSSKFQSSMTIFQHKLLTREGRVLADGRTHPPSMTTFVHLFKRSVSRRVTLVT